MDDKELLERAARAAGKSPRAYTCMGLRVGEEGSIWNPLEDDGDAFRLMAALRLCVSYSDTTDGTDYIGIHHDWGGHILREPASDLKTVRRAIVRASAALAEGK